MIIRFPSGRAVGVEPSGKLSDETGDLVGGDGFWQDVIKGVHTARRKESMSIGLEGLFMGLFSLVLPGTWLEVKEFPMEASHRDHSTQPKLWPYLCGKKNR